MMSSSFVCLGSLTKSTVWKKAEEDDLMATMMTIKYLKSNSNNDFRFLLSKIFGHTTHEHQ